MPLSINTNIASLTAQRAMLNSNSALETSFERLSTGKRINSASDDAAGLAIGKDLESRVSGLNQAVRNVNDGISMVQIAEGALDEVTSILQRMRDLSVQASNGSLSATERGYLDVEHEKLAETLGKVIDQSQFNGTDLVSDSAATPITIQSGADASDTTSLSFAAMTESTLRIDKDLVNLAGTSSITETVTFDAFALGKSSVDFGALSSISVADSASLTIKIDGTTYTAANGTGSTITAAADVVTLFNTDANFAGTNLSTVGTVNYTGSTLTFVYNDATGTHAGGANAIGTGATAATAAGTVANAQAASDVFTLTVGSTTYVTDAAAGDGTYDTNKEISDELQSKLVAAGETGYTIATVGDAVNGNILITYAAKGNQTETTYKLEKTTGVDGAAGADDTSPTIVEGASKASDAITAIDSALAAVASERATLGATQAQLESTVRNLANVAENTSAAAGRIMDTDYAAETANLTKAQILQQAATSILAQANAQPQSVLSLLQ
jgi:flagellin